MRKIKWKIWPPISIERADVREDRPLTTVTVHVTSLISLGVGAIILWQLVPSKVLKYSLVVLVPLWVLLDIRARRNRLRERENTDPTVRERG